MNKSQLVDAVKEQTSLTKKDIELVVNTLFDTIATTLQQGDKVAIGDFGTFSVKTRAARKGRNPQTGEEIEVAEAKAPAFKPFKSLKDAVNK